MTFEHCLLLPVLLLCLFQVAVATGGNNSTNTGSSDDDGGLSVGAIIGITLGSLVFCAGCCYGMYELAIKIIGDYIFAPRVAPVVDDHIE